MRLLAFTTFLAIAVVGCSIHRDVKSIRPDNPADGGILRVLTNGNWEVTSGFIMRSYQWKRCCEDKQK